MASHSNMLNLLAEKMVQPAMNPNHLAYCPTMDLIAIATVDEQISVYRLNGQKVFGISNKADMGKINAIRWKPNGQIIATAFDNKCIYLTSAHTGKVVHQLDYSPHCQAAICFLAWGINSTGAYKVKHENGKPGPEAVLDDLLSKGTKQASDAPPDLPRDLAFLDVEALLPRLSSLALGGVEENLFHSRTSLETVFQPSGKEANDFADVLIVGFEDGTIHLSIYDFFEIGHFVLPTGSPRPQRSKLIAHTSHPYSTTHPLLVSQSTPSGEELQMLPLDLRMISSAGRYIALLASKSTQLHNVLRYMQQVQKYIYAEFKSSQELPRRFMRNVEETLAERHDCTWMHAAYHLVVTGNCYTSVKEWLVDELGERGFKRWDKAATTGYETVRRYTHENLLPALERFTVLVSRLRGLSRFQDSNAGFGLSTQDLDSILDTTSCLQLVAHHILITAAAELRQFSAFSLWLHHEIEAQSTDSNPSAAQEASERDDNIDHRSTLEYIQGAMNRSRLFILFNFAEPAERKSQWNLAAEGRSLYDLYKRELDDQSRAVGTEKQLPGLDALIDHLVTQCNAVFAKIAETQKRNVRFGTSLNLGKGIPNSLDMRMLLADTKDPGDFTLYIVAGSRDDTGDGKLRERSIELELTGRQLDMTIENGISTTRGIQRTYIQVPRFQIQDVKFVDDNSLMLATKSDASSHLLSVRYRAADSDSEGLTYEDITAATKESAESTSSPNPNSPALRLDPQDEEASQFVQHTFPVGSAWTPECIEVNGRKGRRAICVPAQDRLRYRVFDLDSSPSSEDTLTYGEDAVMT